MLRCTISIRVDLPHMLFNSRIDKDEPSRALTIESEIISKHFQLKSFLCVKPFVVLYKLDDLSENGLK